MTDGKLSILHVLLFEKEQVTVSLLKSFFSDSKIKGIVFYF